MEDYQIVSKLIFDQKDVLAATIVDRQWQQNAEVASKYGPTGKEKALQDVGYHLAYLSEAIAVDSITLFVNYVVWVKGVLEELKIATSDLIQAFELTNEVLTASLPAETHATINRYLQAGIFNLYHAPAAVPSEIDASEPFGELATGFLNLLLDGKRSDASQLILDTVESGTSVKNIYLHVFQKTQHEVGRLWQMNRVSVAQEHYITAATQMIMSQLYPYIFSTRRNDHRLVATCVGGELHEIGVRMVADFFEMEGWDTYYLGANSPPHSVVQALDEQQADILAISATMTFHVSKTSSLIEQVYASNVGRNVKILVGGYPFNLEPNLWQQVGATGFATDAQEAVNLANHLVTTGV